MSERDPTFVPPLRQWLLAAAVLVVLLGTGLYRIHEMLYEHARHIAEQQLYSVASVKSHEIQRWLNDRLVFLNEPPSGTMAKNLARLVKGSEAASAVKTLQARFRYLNDTNPEISSIWLYDLDGHPILGSNAANSLDDTLHRTAVHKVREKRCAVFVDLHRAGDTKNVPALDILAPLFLGDEKEAPIIGFVLFQIDPTRQLYPLIQRWPVPSPTAESLLLRREGSEVIYLSPPRHQAVAPLTLREPIDNPELISGKAWRGVGEILAGLDYRGEPVFGVVLSIPDTDWLLMSKMDDREIFTDARQRFLGITAGLAVLLMVLVILGRTAIAHLRAKAHLISLTKEKARLETIARAEKALAESEQRLRALGDNLPDSYVYQLTRTPEGQSQFLYLSSGVERISGVSAEAVLQDTNLLYGQVDAEYIPLLVAAENESLAHMTDFAVEFRTCRPDGQSRWLHARSRPIRRGDGQVVWHGVVTDITVQKTAELTTQEALAAAERFRASLDHVPAHVYMKDGKSRYVYANQPTLDRFGCTADELIGATDERFLPPETARRLREIDRRVLAGEETAEEVDVTYPGGERVVYWEVKAPIYTDRAHRTIWGLCGISTDVTTKKRNEETLALLSRRAESLLKLPPLAEQLDEIAFVQSGQEYAEDLTGSSISFIHFVNDDERSIELVAWSLRTLTQYCKAAHDRHYPVTQAGIWADALRQRKPILINDYPSVPGKHGLPEGHAELKRFISVPVMEGGKVVMLAGVGNKNAEYTERDIETVQLFADSIWHIVQRRRAARTTLEALATQRALNKKLEEAQNQLLQSEKLASIGQLAAGVAHEINNPIGFVTSNIGTLEKYLQDILSIISAYEEVEASLDGHCPQLDAVRDLKRDKKFDYLKADIVQLMAESKEGLARVAKIVRDLKDFSRAGEATLEWADLHQGIDSTLNIAWNELKYKCTVNKEYGELPPVRCVLAQLNQVFMNLLVNAAHAIPEKGEITIRTGRQGEEVFVAVTDTGSGITPENLTRIFEPFFTTKPVGSGTGLGLSLAYGIVKKHQGRIEVQSKVGKGTTFTVWLPIEARAAE